MFEERSYLVVLSVSNEREPRFSIMRSQDDAREYIEKLKKYLDERKIATVIAQVFYLGEPLMVIG